MKYRYSWLILPAFLLAACERDLDFKIRFAEVRGLQAGAPLLLDKQAVGKVLGVEKTADGQLVNVSVDHNFLRAATDESKFFLDDVGDGSGSPRIVIEQSSPGGKAIPAGAVVQGEDPGPFGIPFAHIMRQLSGALRSFKDQAERFRQDFDNIPDSDEAGKLRDEWKRLMEEIERSRDTAENKLYEEVLPKLQKDLEELRRKLEEQRQRAEKAQKPKVI